VHSRLQPSAMHRSHHPLPQAALMISGILGIFVFREIVERPAIVVFFLCAGLVVVGAVLLGLFGPGTKQVEA
jgi:glucose uptake protein GlcU